MTFPKRPKSHVTGDRAVRIFKAACAPSWLVADVAPDYGLDLCIELTDGDQVIGQEIHVQVKGTSRRVNEPPTIKIRQATINYWLAKLAPILIVLVDTSSSMIWYGWLEYAYLAYPKQRDQDTRVSLSLNNNATDMPLSKEVPQYAARYYGQLGVTTTNLGQRARLIEILFHVVRLTRLFYELLFYLEGLPGKHKKASEIYEKLRLFYQEFGTHDVLLQDRWRRFATATVPTVVLDAFGSRFSAYERLKKTFFAPASTDDKHPSPIIGGHPHSQFIVVNIPPGSPMKLISAVGPTIHVLRDIEGMIFRILLFGRIEFLEE